MSKPIEIPWELQQDMEDASMEDLRAAAEIYDRVANGKHYADKPKMMPRYYIPEEAYTLALCWQVRPTGGMACKFWSDLNRICLHPDIRHLNCPLDGGQ